MNNEEFKKGRIIFDNGEVIDAHSTELAFLGSNVGRSSVVFVKNREYCSYSTPVVGVFGAQCVVVLFFREGVLMRVNITVCGSVDDASEHEAAAFSEEELKMDKIKQDRWLICNLGGSPPYDFSWGSVESVLDKRSWSCNVVIVYAGAAGATFSAINKTTR
ncbi:MAG: hypothetical protein H7067_06995 [Burkholderiales bacterium]|nr:hypothetical protein [Opitutaceae bacterium]